MKLTSRRSVLVLAAAMPAIITAKAHSGCEDIALLRLGEQFNALAAHLDHAIEHELNIDWVKLEEFSRIEAEIVQTPATTLEGLCVKSRAACWALLGYLEQCYKSNTYERMAL